MKYWVVKKNGGKNNELAIIGSTVMPKNVIAKAPLDENGEFVKRAEVISLIQVPGDDGVMVTKAVIDEEKRLDFETKVSQRKGRLKQKQADNSELVKAAKAKLKNVDFDKVKTVKELKSIVCDIATLINEMK